MITSQARQSSSILQLVVVLALLFSLLPARGFAQEPLPLAKIHPALREVMQEENSQLMRVIVQASGPLADVRQGIQAAGGVIISDLSIINAVVADMPAAGLDNLAQSPLVQAISPDAPVLKTADSTDGTVVMQQDFNGSTEGTPRTVNWNWYEVGEEDGFDSGNVVITSFLAGTAEGVRFQNSEMGVQATVDLRTALNATMSMNYRRKEFTSAQDAVLLQVSTDGGVAWQEVARLVGPATDPMLQVSHYDLSAFRGHEVLIRLITFAEMSTGARFYLDFVQVQYEEDPQFSAHKVLLPLISAPNTAAAHANNEISSANGTFFVRDEFNSTSYTNNDGTQQWSGGWIESGDNGSPTGGDITVEIDECPDVNSQCIEFDGDADLNSSVAREVNLGGIGSATLTFDYDLDISGALYVLEASNNGGTSWQILKNYSAPATVIGESIDLTPYAATNTRIRFRLADREDNAHLSIDNVQITWSAVAPLSVPDGASVWTVRDEFNSISYSNNDGTRQWSGGWIELGDNDSPSSGDITVEFDECPDVNSQCIEFDADADLNSSLARQVDLSGGGSALLSFDYHLDESGAVYALEVSTDGGVTWQTLKNYVSPAIVIGEKVDLTPYTAVNTQIRFRLTDDDNDAHLSIDNVQIEWGDGDYIDTTNLASTYVKSIKADKLWNNRDKRLRGRNVTVAVVDSGIARHFDLDDDDDGDGRAGRDDGRRSRILAHVDFTGGGFLDDFYGHGTHVAGIIAGNGKESNNTYMGVAPKANLVDVKVTDDYGVGSTADVVAGLEWVLEHKDLYNIRVVNMSLNSTLAESYHTSPLDAAVEILWFNGIVVVVSAGNNGSTNAGTIYPPANDPFIITVGAVDDMGTQTIDDDILATYSAYGLTSDGFLKPEIVVPGSNIIASLSGDDANLALDHPSHSVTGPAGTFYFRMSGTSMASAVVAGSVALLLEDEPNLTPDQVKYRLMATASYPIEIPLAVPTPDITTFRPAYMDIKAAVDGTTVEIANQGVMPHLVLAKMAMMAYWATTNGEEAIDWSSVNWNSVNWNSVNWNSVNWNSVNWNSVNWNSVNWNSVNWNSVNWNSGFTWSSVNWNSGFTWSSVNWNSVHWDD